MYGDAPHEQPGQSSRDQTSVQGKSGIHKRAKTADSIIALKKANMGIGATKRVTVELPLTGGNA